MKMRPRKHHIPLIAGLLSGIVFILLMGIRLGVFDLSKAPEHRDMTVASDQESWMAIYRNDEKIGYSHRRLEKTGDGYRLDDKTHLRLNIMGLVQDMRVKTIGNLNTDFSLSSFSFDLSSGLFGFSAKGQVKNNTLHIQMDRQEMEFPLSEPIYLLSGILDAAGLQGLKKGEKRAYYVFDPATLDRKPVEITLEGFDTLTIMEQPVKTLKFSLDFMGLKQTAWTTEDGTVVMEKGLMGIQLVKSDKKEALAGSGASDVTDLTESISVASDVDLENQNALSKLTLTLSGPTDHFFLNGGRQRFKSGLLTIEKEETAAPMSRTAPPDSADFLKPSSIIQSDHPAIRQIVADIVSMDDSNLTKAIKIMDWMSANIEKRPVLSIPNALETLENKMGDCNEHAVLFAAMARAVGVPTQIEAGLVHMRGRFYYHAWNVIYQGQWITVDALMGQIPADVSHIRLIRGGTLDQLNLVHAIGNLKISILETAND